MLTPRGLVERVRRGHSSLPREELIAKLHSLTNLRVVRDASSPSGWEVDLAHFPGWRDVPAW